MTSRPLTRGEAALALAVFGDTIALDRVRLHGGGFGRFAVTLGSHIFLPDTLARADFSGAELGAQALLIHELVHAWQFQQRPLNTLASWAATLVSGGYGPGLPCYRYTLPITEFGRLGLERQASVVEHLFILRGGARSPSMPAGLTVEGLAAVVPFPVAF